MTSSDFQTRNVEIRAIGSDGISYVADNGSAGHVPLDRFLQIRRESTLPATRTGWQVILSDGDCVAGEATSMDAEQLHWHSPLLGDMAFPLRQVAAIHRATDSSTPPASATEDVVHLSNGDSAHGVINAISNQGVTVQTTGASPTLAWNTINSVDFASLAPPSTQPIGEWRMGLDDGSTLHANAVEWVGSTINLILNTRQQSIESSHIVSIEQTNGPVVFLASLKPAEDLQIPLFGSPWPTRFGQDLLGNPLPQAISVHAYSHLVWKLPDGFTTLHLQYAIPADLPLADISVRVLVDGKNVYEKSHLHSDTSPPAMNLPLNQGHEVTLEVDTASPYRTQGWLTWISPALVR